MRETQMIEWTRTSLRPQEREELLTTLQSEQKAHLLEHDYVWVEGVGVLWNPPHGDPLRRARFTHGTRFQTDRGEFYIDSEGSAREISNHRFDPPAPLHGEGTRRQHGDGAPTESSLVEAPLPHRLDSTPGSSGRWDGAQNAKAT